MLSNVEHLVIESEPELRHPREVDSHLDHAHNLRSQHVSLGSGKEVDTLDDIEEDFILAILDAIRPPGHGIGHRWRGLGRPGVQLETLLIIIK